MAMIVIVFLFSSEVKTTTSKEEKDIVLRRTTKNHIDNDIHNHIQIDQELSASCRLVSVRLSLQEEELGSRWRVSARAASGRSASANGR